MRVMILWHMHQPMYGINRDASGARFYPMPWVFVHGIREYYDMIEMVRRTHARVTFNLVPSLILQLEDYISGKANDLWIKHFLKPAEQLSEREQEFIRQNFFSMNYENFIKPYPEFAALLGRRNDRLSVQEYRDIQVYWILAQLSAFYHREDARVKRLVAKGRNFSEYDKSEVFGIAMEIIGKTLKLYHELAAEGVIEVSTTPFYHPILPLLIDIRVARVSMPDAPMPKVDFRHPEDAERHVETALEFMKERGYRVNGMWPAEGSVSEDAVSVFSKYGVRWIATDEGILKRSGMDDPHKVYAFKGVKMFFRDHGLSDAIGFTYQKMQAEMAVDDFIMHLENMRRARPNPVVSIILDGENPWPGYPDGGLDFLELLYDRLKKDFDLITPSDVGDDEVVGLERLFPGSWIRSDFSMWIGNSAKNRAWEVLHAAREEFGSLDSFDAAASEFMAAEGSDWFWWYGDVGNPYGALFDEVFREHLKRAFELKGVNAPDILDEPIQETEEPVFKPSGEIHPRLDGKVSSYFEWLYAGTVDFTREWAGTMMPGDLVLRSLMFGTDGDNLYFMFQADRPMTELLGTNALRVIFKDVDAELIINNERAICRCGGRDEELKMGLADVVEVAVPLKLLGNRKDYEIKVELVDGQEPVERHPQSGWFKISIEPDDWPL